MKTKTILAVVLAAGVALSMTAKSETVTSTINGIEWRYSVTGQNVTLGGGNANLSAIVDTTASVAAENIPWTFSVGGIDYTVTQIAARAFNTGAKLTGTLTIPASVTQLSGDYTVTDHSGLTGVVVEGSTKITGQGVFKGCKNIATALFKRSVVSMKQLFNGCSGMKAVLFGPDATCYANGDASCFQSASAQECKVYCPATSTWETFKNAGPGGSGVEVVLYGEAEDLNLVVDESAHTITATVKSLDMLEVVLGSAQYFKSGMGLDTRINVPVALDIPSGTITSAQLQYATFNTLMIAATTQEKLDNILAVVPPAVPVCIDATGATQNLHVSTSDGRNVYVRLPENGTYKLRPDGFVISFR